MLTRSDDYIEYCRETAKHARDPHDLALRGRKNHDITRRIHQRIIRAVDLHRDDDLVDIGCGDGTLLRMANTMSVRSALGLLATEEEVDVLRRFGLNVRQGYTDHLPVADQSASVIVCNNVLLVVPREKIPASLREIYRIARLGARVFLGEIPFVETQDPTPPFNTRRELLSHLYRNRGLPPGSEWCAAWPGGRSPGPRQWSIRAPRFRSGLPRRNSSPWPKAQACSSSNAGSTIFRIQETTTCFAELPRRSVNPCANGVCSLAGRHAIGQRWQTPLPLRLWPAQCTIYSASLYQAEPQAAFPRPGGTPR